MSQENVERVRAAYEVVLPHGSVEGFEDRFADDFTWHQRAEWPGRSVYKRDEMALLWAELDGTYSDFSVVALDFADVGEYVVVTVSTSARLRTSDDQIDGTVWHVWRLRDGLLAEVRVYSTRQEAHEAAGLPD